MPPHSSQLLQPLNISCFVPLKHYYSQKIREIVQNGIHAINKMDFLSIYTKIHGQAFSTTNILSGFTAAGLIPSKPERVLAKLNIKIPTPPSSSIQQLLLLFRKNTSQSLLIKSAEKAD